jgi:hypothetical protein
MVHTTFRKAMILPLLFTTFLAVAQTSNNNEKPKVSAKIVGSVAVVYNPSSQSEYLTFGGPGIRVDYKACFVALHFYPSLRYYNGDMNDAADAYRTKVRGTILTGFGPQFGYKRLAFVFPFYYLTGNNVWIMSAGLGYKL